MQTARKIYLFRGVSDDDDMMTLLPSLTFEFWVTWGNPNGVLNPIDTIFPLKFKQ